MVLLIIAFASLAIGAPLAGLGVFAGTDLLTGTAKTALLDNTVDSAFPQSDLFFAMLRHGTWLNWNPYIAGGVPLAATPNAGLLSPLMVPYLILPGWLAPAEVKLLEIICSVAGCFVYLRRIRLSRVAALLGGLVFVTSGFMIIWTNWPQSRVAAFIPALFWAVERLAQRRHRPIDVALLALIVAAMLLGGFPAVTGYALYTAAGYYLVRAAVTARYRLKALGYSVAAGAGGVLLGFGLAAFQLIPFGAFMDHAYIADRRQHPGSHLSPAALVTTVAPWAAGTTNPDRPPAFFLRANFMESMSYLGVAALVLVLYAVSRPRSARQALPPGVFVTVVAASLLWLELIYFGGPVLALLQHLPVFNFNFVSRARCMPAFLLAVLAAVGYELLVHRPETVTPTPRWRQAVATGLWAAVFAVLVGVWFAARHAALVAPIRSRYAASSSVTPIVIALDTIGKRTATLTRQGLLAIALFAVASGLVLLARRRERAWRAAGVALLPVLVVAQALSVTTPLLPRPSRDTFYPRTDAVSYLAANLGADRVAGNGLFPGIATQYRLRSLDGHAYVDRKLTELMSGVPSWAMAYHTLFYVRPDPGDATSPILDRLAARYFVAPATANPFGTVQRAAPPGGTVTLQPGQSIQTPLPSPGPLRGIGFTIRGPVSADTALTVVLRDPAGALLGRGVWRPPQGFAYGPDNQPVIIAVAGEDIAASTPVTAEFTLTGSGPVTLLESGSTPVMAVFRPAADNLRLVFAGSAVVYQRLTALPRIRWASQQLVLPENAQVAALAAGQVPADTVVVARAAGPADGKPAQLHVRYDKPDAISLDVQAEGAGYVVVADALRTGWSVAVDGRPAAIVPADHAVAAVAVPAGTHRITLRYTSPAGNLGTWLSLASVGLLLLLCAAGTSRFVRWLRIRRSWQQVAPWTVRPRRPGQPAKRRDPVRGVGRAAPPTGTLRYPRADEAPAGGEQPSDR